MTILAYDSAAINYVMVETHSGIVHFCCYICHFPVLFKADNSSTDF